MYGACHLCGRWAEVCNTVGNPDQLICYYCYQGGKNMGWNDAQGKGAGDATHLQIKPNQTVKLHIMLKEGEEPLSYWTHFIKCNDGKARSVICPGRDVCPACKAGTIKARRRHAVNVWDYESNAVKIFETGNSVMQQLKLIYDQFGGLETLDVAIRKSGTGLDTVYTVTAMIRPTTEPFVWGEKELYELSILKSPTPIEKIASMISGAPVQAEMPKVQTKPLPTEAPMATPTSTLPQFTLSFGKYKGKTMVEVWDTDKNYVRWCAENIEDFAVKAEARRIVASGASPKEVADNSQKAELLSKVQTLLNTDDRYKTNFSVVVEKMRLATQTPTRPGGKTLLIDYTEKELEGLLELIK